MLQTTLGWAHLACAVITTAGFAFLTFIEWHAYLDPDSRGKTRRTRAAIAQGVAVTLCCWAIFSAAVWL